ncbi:biopolymer transporter ExbD [Afifella sp. IM 167]|uniref:ExbD/TolR family protein n=1 Tax=Afifella sp. IM 167 TaxID=2033586 RepID=UPI001CCE8FE3|nr:biopolymer transporter ExbD [Afifella sp. IM 167]MBZ8135181.1 biopolymer transporter ExbD [Afifella sp. IM 167]
MHIDRHRPRHRAMSMTPLIDVVFLLLLFFMLASTFARFGAVDVSLASEGGGTATPGETRSVLLSVAEDAGFAIDGAAVTKAGIAEALKTGRPEGKWRVVVRASPRAVAQDVVDAIDEARRAAIGPVLLVH